MKNVFVASPYAGDTQENIRYAKTACLDCITRDEAPFAPHLLYPGLLDDGVPEERTMGMACGRAWLLCSDLLVVYTDRGISPGMLVEIKVAERFGIKVEYRKLYDEKL